MTVSSPVSLDFLVWVVVTCCATWLSPVLLRRYVLVVSTIALLAYADPRSLLLLAVSTGIVYIAARAQGRWEATSLLAGCAAVLGMLLVFKTVYPIDQPTSIVGRAIPLGLSYYALRCVHVLIERYLNQIKRPSALGLVEYLFFPGTIIAGPIHRYPTFAAEYSTKFNVVQFSAGLERILYGYFKIVVVCNYLITARAFPWLISELGWQPAGFEYLDSLRYGLTIYFQFSGYSDIAIGFSLLLGHKVMENFRWPLLRSNIVAFWRSWHISLTSLCREYVFTSVYASTRRAWAGVVATMLAISLWHGVTLNYLAWGLYHGAGVVIYQQWSSSPIASTLQRVLPSPVNRLLGWFLTFQFVMLGFVWTKESSLSASVEVFKTLFSWPLAYV